MAKRSPYRVRLMETDRRALGWSYVDLAVELNVHASTITRFFKGQHQSPGMAKRIALALGHPVVRYLHDAEPERVA